MFLDLSLIYYLFIRECWWFLASHLSFIGSKGAFDTSVGEELSPLCSIWCRPSPRPLTGRPSTRMAPHGWPTNAATNGSNWHLCMPRPEEGRDQVGRRGTEKQEQSLDTHTFYLLVTFNLHCILLFFYRKNMMTFGVLHCNWFTLQNVFLMQYFCLFQ